MNWNKWFRHIHRWVSVTFLGLFAAIFVALGLGAEPASWVYFLPLLPLFILSLTGLYMFALPYVTKWKSRRRATG